MTVVDVNTGKFTGSGGNLEETVTKNNLEAAEEIVRQLRLRDIGGIIVVDFIDMVLESNRDLVLRRLVECLGRDRTRHQVAEVTSLGLVQMTRKRIGTGLLESFSHDCPTCHGRGVVVEEAPVEPRHAEEEPRRGRRTRGKSGAQEAPGQTAAKHLAPSPKDIAAMARHERAEAESGDIADPVSDDTAADETPSYVPLDEVDLPIDEPDEIDEIDELDDIDVLDVPADEVHEADEVDQAGQVDEVDEVDQADEVDRATDTEVFDAPTDEVHETDEEPEPSPEPPAAPEPPRVVTRTRRRSASRPAGPPASAANDGSPVGHAVGTGSDALEPGDEGHALHVPVKRKGGARKR
jgi:ribonuclease E